MLKSFRTEIHPTEEQKVRIHKTIGTCRFIYNFYLAHNKELYQNGEKFMSSSKFRVWLNHEYLPQHPEYLWIKEAYSKAVSHVVTFICKLLPVVYPVTIEGCSFCLSVPL